MTILSANIVQALKDQGVTAQIGTPEALNQLLALQKSIGVIAPGSEGFINPFYNPNNSVAGGGQRFDHTQIGSGIPGARDYSS